MWILGFLTFLTGLGAMDALVVWEVKGQDFTFKPYLLGSIVGEISANTYLWTSVSITFLLIGLTAVVGYLRLPPHPHILQGLSKLEEDTATNANMLESVQVGLYHKLEQNQIAIDGTTKTVKTSLKDAENQLQSILNRQGKSMRESFSGLSNSIEQDFANIRTVTANMLEKQSTKLEKMHHDISSTVEKGFGTEEVVNEMKAVSKVLRDVERSTEQSVTGLQWRISKMEEKIAALTDLRQRMERIEMRLTTPEPSLTSQDDYEKIGGMSPGLAEGLKVMGVTKVSEFLTTDASTIADKTRFPKDAIKKLQANAQLLMVPGISHVDAELLEEVNITSRRELADQDPIELARRIAKAAKTYVEQGKILDLEQPTIEEVVSWIRYAKP